MKRALAERAKQSIPEQSPSVTASSTSSPETQPPLKIARPNPQPLVVTTSAFASGQATPGSRTPRSPKPGKVVSTKRPRAEMNGSAALAQQKKEESAVDETSAFYLKHQNRALATELKGWKQKCRELTQERDQRRQSCWRAVQELQSLQAAWTSLETTLGQEKSGKSASSLNNTETSLLPSTPLVMGRKTEEDPTDKEDPALAIEWTGALHQALQNLAFPQKTAEEKEPTRDVGDFAANISARASCLQGWLWRVLTEKQVSMDHLKSMQPPEDDFASKCELIQHQAAELTRSRDYWRAQERRLRRNLYRLEAGMVTLPQVMNALESISSEDDDHAGEDAEIRAAVQLEKSAQAPPEAEKNQDGEAERVSSTVVDKLHQLIGQLEQEKKRRDETIVELNQQVKTQGERINQLSVKQKSEEDTKRLETLESTLLELSTATTRASALQTELETTKERWSIALGNEATALTSLKELQQSHAKHWAEANESGGSSDEEVIELRHKLQQAIEHVRQAEDARSNLADALDLNEKLKLRIEELKVALDDEKDSPTGKEETTMPSSSGSSDKVSAEKYDKLHREYRKVREKLSMMAASKESYKGKLERADKDRESLNEMNARLIRQMAEKEEVNAKSLSSILHLKSMTEELSAQRANLEEQANSASQLALAARLASNAKDRVAEELTKEKTEIEERLKKADANLEAAQSELADLKREYSGKTSKHASLSLELSNALKRADELVAEEESKREEIRRLVDSLDKAEKEAKDWKEKVERLSKASGGSGVSEFTVEQLNTQVSVLKSRLACPVCHYRDKGCIVIKCGHLHCKQCVEERISNRSRKCPTCNQMFSKTDVMDVFLG